MAETGPCLDCVKLAKANDKLENELADLRRELATLKVVAKDAKRDALNAMRYADRSIEAALIEL